MTEKKANPGFMGQMKDVAMKALPAAATAATLTVGGALADTAMRGIKRQVGSIMSHRRMNQYLDDMTPEMREHVLGGDYGPSMVRRRFQSLYNLAPDLMGDPSTAAGLVSESLRVSEGAISPGVAREFSEMQRTMEGRQQPGMFGEFSRMLGDPLMRQTVSGPMREEERALDQQQHEQKMEWDKEQHQQRMQSAEADRAARMQIAQMGKISAAAREHLNQNVKVATVAMSYQGRD